MRTLLASVVHRPRPTAQAWRASMLPPGVPAMFVLLGVTCVGSDLSKVYIKASPQYANLAELCATLTGVATVFWFWAAYNLLALHGADYGVVSFLVALVANYRTADLCTGQLTGHHSASLVTTQRWLQPASCLLVAVNYLWLLFTVQMLPLSYRLYTLVAASYWVGAAWHTNMYLLDVKSADANLSCPSERCSDRNLDCQEIYGSDNDELQDSDNDELQDG